MAEFLVYTERAEVRFFYWVLFGNVAYAVTARVWRTRHVGSTPTITTFLFRDGETGITQGFEPFILRSNRGPGTVAIA